MEWVGTLPLEDYLATFDSCWPQLENSSALIWKTSTSQIILTYFMKDLGALCLFRQVECGFCWANTLWSQKQNKTKKALGDEILCVIRVMQMTHHKVEDSEILRIPVWTAHTDPCVLSWVVLRGWGGGGASLWEGHFKCRHSSHPWVQGALSVRMYVCVGWWVCVWSRGASVTL